MGGNVPARNNNNKAAMLQNLSSVLARKPEQVDWSAFAPQDWQQFVRAAHMHSVAPLLWHTLEDMGWPDDVPAHVRNALHRAFYQTTAHNTLLYRELERILAALQEQDIPVVVLKGAALANTVYPHIGLRPMRDLDLLVQSQHIDMTLHTLHNLGYRQAVPEITPGFNRRYHHHHVGLQGGSHASVIIEIHWQLVARDQRWRSPPLDWFWQHTQSWHEHSPQATAGRAAPAEALCFTPTASLLYLAAHLVLQHGGMQAPLLWLYDLHLLLTRCPDALDWDDLIEQAHTARWSAVLHTALQHTRTSLETPVPPHVLDTLAALSTQRDRRLVQLLEQRSSQRVVTFWYKLAACPWRDRFWFIARYLVPSPAYIRWQYPVCEGRWLCLCYGYHWYILVQYVLRGMLRIVRKIV
jgi:hypothetical protein